MRTGLQLATLLGLVPRLEPEGDPSGTAVADPPAPPAAPAAPAEPTPHPQDDRRSPVQRATHDLRQRIESGEVAY